jgi:hypothetical protein
LGNSNSIVYSMLENRLKAEQRDNLEESDRANIRNKLLNNLNSDDIFKGIILSEILGKPVSKRKRSNSLRRY